MFIKRSLQHTIILEDRISRYVHVFAGCSFLWLWDNSLESVFSFSRCYCLQGTCKNAQKYWVCFNVCAYQQLPRIRRHIVNGRFLWLEVAWLLFGIWNSFEHLSDCGKNTWQEHARFTPSVKHIYKKAMRDLWVWSVLF